MSIRTTLFFVSYCTYLLAYGTLAITKCGLPGKPFNGTFSPEKTIYSENQTVAYSCQTSFKLFHDDGKERTCSRNGSWTGSTPICMPNIVYQRETITVYPSSGKVSRNKYLVDQKQSTCLELKNEGKTRWVRIGLERKLGVREIWLYSRKFSVKVSVIDTLTNKSTLCGRHTGYYRGSDGIRIYCTAPEDKEGFPGGTPGDTILIEELTAGNNKPLVFCEIQAYAYYGNTDCGLAEAPAFGSAEYVGPKRVEYKCQSGFTLIGPSYRYCDPDGALTYWPKNTTPTCKLEKWQESFNTGRKCVNLDSHIANARIYYELDGSVSVAIVECNDGFELMANKVLLCTSFGVWLGYADHGLHCKLKITCSEPPSVANTILANIQGYSEGSEAIYLCGNLAEPANDQSKYFQAFLSGSTRSKKVNGGNRRDLLLQTSATFSQAGVGLGISNCQANGTWSDLPSKFICQVSTTTTTELTTVTSRSENSTENLEYLHSTIDSLESACGKLICSEPPSVANTILANIQGYSEGSQATYLCGNLAEPANDQRLGISNCQANGTWSGLPSKFICQVPTTTTTELVTAVTSTSENSTENLEYPNSTIPRLLESAFEISWKTAFICTVIWACISTMFSILACCYFFTRQQRRNTEGDVSHSMHSQLQLGRDESHHSYYSESRRNTEGDVSHSMHSQLQLDESHHSDYSESRRNTGDVSHSMHSQLQLGRDKSHHSYYSEPQLLE